MTTRIEKLATALAEYAKAEDALDGLPDSDPAWEDFTEQAHEASQDLWNVLDENAIQLIRLVIAVDELEKVWNLSAAVEEMEKIVDPDTAARLAEFRAALAEIREDDAP